MVAFRIIYHAVQAAVGIEKVPISKKIMLDVHVSHSRYIQYLKETKQENEEVARDEEERKKNIANIESQIIESKNKIII